MRRHHITGKKKQTWEVELLECLEEARRHLRDANGDDRKAAIAHYYHVLAQFNGLVLRGEIPPEEPCYT